MGHHDKQFGPKKKFENAKETFLVFKTAFYSFYKAPALRVPVIVVNKGMIIEILDFELGEFRNFLFPNFLTDLQSIRHPISVLFLHTTRMALVSTSD